MTFLKRWCACGDAVEIARYREDLVKWRCSLPITTLQTESYRAAIGDPQCSSVKRKLRRIYQQQNRRWEKRRD